MKVKLLKTEEEYESAISRLEEIFDAVPGTEEGDELETLVNLIEKYEDVFYPIDSPDPIRAIEYTMEAKGYRPSDLAKVIGLRSQVAEILARKRKLTLEMIRALSKEWGIPSDVLIHDYKLTG